LNDIKKTIRVTNLIKQGITRQGQDERNRCKLEIGYGQMPAKRKSMNKAQFTQRVYKMNTKKFTPRNVRKTKKAREVDVKSIVIKWIISYEENNRIYSDEERINVYEWALNMCRELMEHEDNIKIITLFDK
jgi:hypothetical protein